MDTKHTAKTNSSDPPTGGLRRRMKILAEAEKPGVAVPVVARVVAVEVPVRVVAVEVRHDRIATKQDRPHNLYRMSSTPPPLEYPPPQKNSFGGSRLHVGTLRVESYLEKLSP